MTILFINRFFFPDTQGTAFVLNDLAQDAAKAGHSVTVLTSDAAVDDPSARYPARGVWEGIEIRRVRAGRFNRQTVIGWLLNSLLFYPSALWAIFRTPRHDITVFLSDPPMIYSLGPLVRFFKKTKYVYWSQDLYPDVAVAAGVLKPHSPITLFFSWLSRWSLRRADLIIAIGEHMRTRILAKGVNPERIVVIHNWTDSSRVHPIPVSDNPFAKQHGLSGKFIVMYSGNMGLSHEFNTILDSAKQLESEKDLLFLLIGSGKQAAKLKETAGSLPNIRFLPFQPYEKLSESLSAGSVHVVTLKDGMEGTLVPSKFYSALAVARPVVFIGSPKSEPADIIEAANCGTSIWPGDTKGFIEAVTRYRDDKSLADTHGTNGHSYFLSHFDRPISTAAILRSLSTL